MTYKYLLVIYKIINKIQKLQAIKQLIIAFNPNYFERV